LGEYSMTLTDLSNIFPPDLSPAEFRQYKVLCAALWCYYNEADVHYSNGRGREQTDQLRRPPPAVPSNLDCTSYIHWCFAVAGCPDPSGGGTFGSKGGDFMGNTATLWEHGRLIGGPDVKVRQLLPGDICFYSLASQGSGMVGGNGEHASLHMSKGDCLSHGSEHGPKKTWYNSAEDTSGKPLYGVRRYEF
jgi:hypothetical protein